LPRKKKTVLYVDGMLDDIGANGTSAIPRRYDLGISVNGLAMQPSIDFGPGSADASEDCGLTHPYSESDMKCTAVGRWWLDMDDPANAALIGVPITVTLVGGDPSGGPAVGGVPLHMTWRVRLEKK
jgi:hypothetical protein